MAAFKQFVPKSACLVCLGCCRFRERKSIWRPHFLKSEKQAIKKISLKAGPGEGNFFCSFLNPETNKCSIYHMRLFECRLYPFLIRRKNKKIFLAVHLNCPHIGKKLAGNKFKEYAAYLAKILKSKEFLKILKDNPQIAQAYEDTRNLEALARLET